MSLHAVYEDDDLRVWSEDRRCAVESPFQVVVDVRYTQAGLTVACVYLAIDILMIV